MLADALMPGPIVTLTIRAAIPLQSTSETDDLCEAAANATAFHDLNHVRVFVAPVQALGRVERSEASLVRNR